MFVCVNVGWHEYYCGVYVHAMHSVRLNPEYLQMDVTFSKSKDFQMFPVGKLNSSRSFYEGCEKPGVKRSSIIYYMYS